jgi:hypothetical protein
MPVAHAEIIHDGSWVRAVINTDQGAVEGTLTIESDGTLINGVRVLQGWFDDPSNYPYSPEVFVEIWFDDSDRLDVVFFSVSDKDVEVYSDYPYDGTPDEQGTLTGDERWTFHTYNPDGSHDSYVQVEDGNSPAGYPGGYPQIGGLVIGAMINTVEVGSIEAAWHQDGHTTKSDYEVLWGYFYRTTGSELNY